MNICKIVKKFYRYLFIYLFTYSYIYIYSFLCYCHVVSATLGSSIFKER